VLVAAAPALSFITGLSANSTGTLTVNGTVATVSGTVQCEPGDAFVAARLRQPSGRTFTEGFGEIEFVCDGTIQSWSFLIPAPLGAKWKTGKATLGAFAEDADNFIEIQTTVRLNKG
jgi:hypothetical protein